jgi:hypothetical protein
MDNIDPLMAWILGLTLIILLMTIIIIFEERFEKKCHIRPELVFTHLHHHKNFNYMAIISSLTLTSVAPVTLSMSVVDANNNNALIAGTLSGLAYTPTDSAQDIAVPDLTVATDVDIHAVTDTGGTTITAIGTFVSTSLNPDGTPKVNGKVTGTLVLVNNIPVAVLNPVLAFNQ